jgi:hypothetical protein
MHPHEAVEVVVKYCVVRWDRSGPWRRGEESLGNEGGLAPNGDDDPIDGAVGALPSEFLADFAVDFGGDEDASS